MTVPVRTGRVAVGALVLAFSAAFFFGGLALGMGTLTAVGSGAFPAFAGALGMLGGGLAVLEGVLHRGDAVLRVELPTRAGAIRMLAFVLALALFALLIERVGFLLTGCVTCAITAVVSGQPRKLRALAFAVGLALAVYVLFTELLEVQLPGVPFLDY